MKLTTYMLCLASLALFAANPALAQDEEEYGWNGKGEFGFVKTSGNTDTQTAKLGLEFVKTSEKWEHRIAASVLNAEDSGTTTAERYDFGLQSNYKLSDVSYVFGALRYENDEFSAYDNQTTITSGYGRKVIDTETRWLNFEIGAGYRDAELALTGMSESEAIARGLIDFGWKITDNTEFTNRFLVESGSSNTFLQDTAALTVAMNDKFALKLGLDIRHNTDVPPLTDDTDTVTSVNLVYNF